MAATSSTIAETITAESDRKLLRLADLSLAEFLRHLARYGGSILEEDGLLLFAGAHTQPNPYRNGLLRLDDQLPADEVVRRADRFFAARKSGYVVWTREHGDAELEAMVSEAAVRDLERLPELVLDELPPDRGAPAGVELRAADDPQVRDDYVRVVADAWGFGAMPLELAAKIFFAPDSLDAPNVVAFVAYYDDLPLSGAMALISHGVALGCQAATIRRPKPGQRLPRPEPGVRGLAESCLYASLQAAFEEHGVARSLCQTSAAGEPVWRKFGYRPVDELRSVPVGARGARVRGGAASLVDLSGFDDDQKLLHESVVAFTQDELKRTLGAEAPAGGFAREAWRRCAELGLLGMPVPTEYGGSGASATTIAVALEAFGYGCADNGLIFSLNAQLWACERPLIRFGTDEQKRTYLPGLCDGTLIAAHAMSEPESGSDAFALRTTATADGDGWVLNGSKTFVTNAPEGDVFVVFATTDRNLGFAGLCAFLVERETPGLVVGPPLAKMGLRSSPMGEIFLSDCRVPAGAMVAGEGAGMVVFNDAMLWERGLILAASVGTMRRQLEQCLRYATEREQFGKPIGSFQAISHRVADMRVRLETSRLLLYRFAGLLDSGAATALDAAITKLHLSDSLVQSSLSALEIHGGYGYMAEYEFEREVRDALASRIYSGTSDMQRNVIAHHLGL